MRRVLVTGATGFIGRELVRALAGRGCRVRALVRCTERGRRLLSQGVELIAGDLTDPGSLEASVDGVDCVFHLGAATSGSWHEQRAATVEGTRNVLQACESRGVKRLVHVSSVAVYDTRRSRDGDRLDEGAPAAEPAEELGPYARAKSQAEQLMREAARRGMGVTILRPGLVYGPGHLWFEHLGKPFRGRLVAYGSKRQLLPLVSVWSVVEALLRVAEQETAIGRTYNVTDERDLSRQDYLDTLERLTSARVPVTYLPVAPLAAAFDTVRWMRRAPGLGRLPDLNGGKLRARALGLRYDSTALARDTGWKPVLDLPRGVQRSIAEEPASLYPWRPLRVGLIGAGMNAAFHLRALARTPGVEIVGVLDTRPEAARTLCEAFGLAGCDHDDAEAFYREAKPQVVHIITPPASHCELAVQALDRGAHVLCEKPMALNAGECERMQEAARARGRMLGVNHNLYFDPRISRARAMIRAGAVGDVLHVETVCGFSLQRGDGGLLDAARMGWVRSMPGGLLEDVAPHTLYSTLGFIGFDAAMPYCRARTSGRAPEGLADELRVSLENARATANITLSLSIQPPELTLTVYGTRGTLKVDVQNMMLLFTRPRRGPKPVARALNVLGASTSAVMQVACSGTAIAARRAVTPGDMTPLLREFYAALGRSRPFEAGAAEGRRVVELLRAIWPQAKAELTTHSAWEPLDTTPDTPAKKQPGSGAVAGGG